MKRTCYVSFCVNTASHGPVVLRSLLKLSCGQGWREPGGYIVVPEFEHTFDAADPRLESLLSFLGEEEARNRVSLVLRYAVEYTEAELLAAPLLEFRVTTAERDVERNCAEQFNFSTGCSACKTGSRQAGPMRVQASGFPKKASICQSIAYQCFVRNTVYEALARAKLTGLDLTQAVSTRGAPLDWWQMIPRHQMPPMAPEQRGYVRDPGLRSCSICRRDGWAADVGKDAPEVVYRRSDLGDKPLPDVTETWECFGLSAFEVNGYIARGSMLVSQKVLKIFRDLQIRHVDFTPVRIIED